MDAVELTLITALALAAGCSSGVDGTDNAGAKTDDDDTVGQSLITSTGDAIQSSAQRCNFDETTGSFQQLEVEVWYLTSAGDIAFGLTLTDPIPAEPYTASEGQQGSTELVAYHDEARYSQRLQDAQISVSLDSLPSPSSLTSGDVIALSGQLSVQPLSLPISSSASNKAAETLPLVAQDLQIDCEAQFRSLVVYD